MHRHPQDDLIIAEALIWMARQCSVGSEMWHHCWAMADEIALEHELALVEVIEQQEPLERRENPKPGNDRETATVPKSPDRRMEDSIEQRRRDSVSFGSRSTTDCLSFVEATS
ncbi:hypothetical protein C479_04497 [Halovivax asiaticus JCM 14624]|uniref:Uncharacterized protein n=1 Tax=Halovivax asiaticus JCM 14624 TaxID=1227490 RepID=M0BP11_9EURY|nr:hypothetical protein [Halovivax asiaticus]ELZ12626.1 hypothetical protein C479_04497 [Halovivax asiaticus JCM 14624]